MATYFVVAQSKPATTTGNKQVSLEDSRPDLLKTQYDLDRKRVMTAAMENKIDTLYKRWCDLLFSGYNLVVTGPNSKWSLLETFKKRYLDSELIFDWCSPSSEPLKITTVRLHGLDPIKMEAFSHAIFNIKETRRIRDADYLEFSQMVKRDKTHYVFLIHSFEYFIDACEDICEALVKLYSTAPNYIHIITSSDHWNGSHRTMKLQHALQFLYSRSVLPGIDSFLWEKTELIGDFNYAEANANETTMHRLFVDKTDLQSLKDIHQALDSATQQILTYIVKDFIDKTDSNANNAEASSKKRFQAIDAEDDEEHELKEEEKADGTMPMRTRRSNANATFTKRSRVAKTISTHLDFQHLLKHCESKFIVRRGTALRDHLGELKDHKLISFDDAGNKIQCLVDLDVGRKFLAWLNEAR